MIELNTIDLTEEEEMDIWTVLKMLNNKTVRVFHVEAGNYEMIGIYDILTHTSYILEDRFNEATERI